MTNPNKPKTPETPEEKTVSEKVSEVLGIVSKNPVQITEKQKKGLINQIIGGVKFNELGMVNLEGDECPFCSGKLSVLEEKGVGGFTENEITDCYTCGFSQSPYDGKISLPTHFVNKFLNADEYKLINEANGMIQSQGSTLSEKEAVLTKNETKERSLPEFVLSAQEAVRGGKRPHRLFGSGIPYTGLQSLDDVHKVGDVMYDPEDAVWVIRILDKPTEFHCGAECCEYEYYDVVEVPEDWDKKC